MPKFKIDFIFSFSETNELIPSKEAELPLEKSAFRTAMLDLEEEAFNENGGQRIVDITAITALEDISEPSIKPNCSPIKTGDVVWRCWEDLDDLNMSMSSMSRLIDEYKPLWEAGPGYEFLIDLLSDEP